MSYVALASDQFEETAAFYGEQLGFRVVEQWDRPTGRGIRFDLGGLRLEILDNARERRPLKLSDPADRLHVVVEVSDISEAHFRLPFEAPEPKTVSWGARMFQVRDPDGIPVTYLQWLKAGIRPLDKIRGRITSGIGRGQYFTQLDWTRQQTIAQLGIDPFPGTLNLILEEPVEVAAWIGLRGTPGIRLENPSKGPNDCDARCYRVCVDGRVDCAIILPEVDEYPECQVELIAPVNLRQLLGKSDGDEVVLEIMRADGSGSKSKKEEMA